MAGQHPGIGRSAVRLGRVHVGSQPVLRIVDPGQYLSLGGEPQENQDRPECLLLGQLAVVVDVAEHARGDEPAVGQVTAEALLTHQ